MIEPRSGHAVVSRLLCVAFLGLVLLPMWAQGALLENGVGYALDDAYIHLGLARGVAEDGVWGLGAGEFVGAGSSILYPLLLAGGVVLAGPWEGWPLVLNLVAGVLVLAGLGRECARRSIPAPVYLLLGAAMLLMAPLGLLALQGMEHVLHVLLFLVWLRAVDDANARPTARQVAALCLIAALLTACRYESVVAVAAGAGYFACRTGGRWAAVWVLAAGAAPPLAAGLHALSQGGLFLPNTFHVKGARPDLGSVGGLLELGTGWIDRLRLYPHVGALMVTGLGLAVVTRRHLLAPGPFLIVTLCTVAQLQVTTVAGQDRTFGYVVAAWLVLIALQCAELDLRPSRARLLRAAPALPLVALFLHAAWSFAAPRVVHAGDRVRNIAEQQGTVARFLESHYGGASVAAHDIGWISYRADLRVFDLVGLGTREVAEFWRGRPPWWVEPGPWREMFEREARARDVEIAVLYRSAFGRALPESWRLAGSWTIVDNHACGAPTVHFFAVAPGADQKLQESLRAFAASVPAGVEQRGPYVAMSGAGPLAGRTR